MAKKKKEIKLVVEFTEGYQQRFTKACWDVLKERLDKEQKEEKTA